MEDIEEREKQPLLLTLTPMPTTDMEAAMAVMVAMEAMAVMAAMEDMAARSAKLKLLLKLMPMPTTDMVEVMVAMEVMAAKGDLLNHTMAMEVMVVVMVAME